MERLKGKVALITGAARGMGAAHARQFVSEGAKVILTDLLEDDGNALTDSLGEGALFFKHDVADPRSWKSIIERGEAKFGHINVLVNNAGITGPKSELVELPLAEYERIIAVNQHSVFYGMREAIPSMIRAGGGSIINISSIAGLTACFGMPNVAYVASKFAIRGLTKAAAKEYGAHNIRVNSVHPGFVKTPMTGATGDELKSRADMTMLKRLGEPEEVSNLVVFLASDESSFITGMEHVIDAGMTAQ